MRLDFNVLWVDDQPAQIESLIESVSTYVDEQGFRLHVDTATSLETAEPYVTDSVFVDELDLVLVDFDLGQGRPGGDEVLRLFRQRSAYKDLVFYSSKMPAELKARVAEAGIEGVYTAARRDLVPTVERVFDTLVKKVLDLDHSRGIVLGATSDIEHVVVEALNAMHGAVDPDGQAKIMAAAVRRMTKNVRKAEQTLARVQTAGTMQALMAEHAVFTAHDKLVLLKELLRAQHPTATAITGSVVDYTNDMPKVRNKLAHVRLVAEGSKRALHGAGGATVVGEAELREARRKLLVYRERFAELAALLEL